MNLPHVCVNSVTEVKHMQCGQQLGEDHLHKLSTDSSDQLPTTVAYIL